MLNAVGLASNLEFLWGSSLVLGKCFELKCVIVNKLYVIVAV